MRRALPVCLLWMALPVQADQVHLVGGAVIEGKASREGDKVIIQLAGGQMAVEADTVEKIVAGTSDVQRFEERYAALREADVEGRMALADFCRDAELHGREHQLLREVIALSPDHAEARKRLGYIRDNGVWLSREEQMRARGLVLFEGNWITLEHQLQIERLRAEARRAANAQEQARVELEARRVELETKRRQQASEGEQNRSGGTTVIVQGGYPYPYPSAPAHPSQRPHWHRGPPQPASRCGAPPCPEQRPRQPRLNPHVRDPSEYF